jgi:diguanylate cyclase (GGDEF)-like protein
MNLQSRILLLFVALLLGIQSISFWITRGAIEDNAKASISTQLEVGERFFMRALLARGARLSEAAGAVAVDPNLRLAVAATDRLALQTFLNRTLEQAKAGSAIYFSSSLSARAAAGLELSPAGLDALRERARQTSTAPAFAIVVDGGQVHQFALAKIRQGDHSGWIAIGFPIDHAALAEVKDISGFDAMIVVKGPNAPPRLGLATFRGADELGDIGAALRRAEADRLAEPNKSRGLPFPEILRVGQATHGARVVSLSGRADSASWAVLTQSLDLARAPYAKLQWVLLALGFGGCATFAFGALLLARSITRPIVELSVAADSLARGDFNATLPSRSPGEVGQLAESFERMRQSIADRESKIHRLAYWDALTGLPNRQQFKEALGAAIVKGGPMSIAHIDVDRLKNVNDTLGQEAGDELLREVARRLLRAPLPAGGLRARLSGDKFALLLPGLDARAAAEFAGQIHELFGAPANIGPSRIDISAGIGVCSVPNDADSVETAMSRAEFAMYAAKQAKTPTLAYDAQLDSSSQASLSLLTELREAIALGQLVLYYQPKADFATGTIAGAEALARWIHPVRGFIAPDAFIPFAEQTGFIGQISRWAARGACEAIARMQAQGMRLKISANISTRDLLDAQFLQSLAESLALTGVDPTLLCLEITEGAMMDHPEQSLKAMAAIRDLGVELSVDDFGTGYSSLGYLARMPINELKIDRAFIVGLSQGSLADEKIVESTIDLAHGLGLRVVAEGAEDALSFGKLRGAGCDMVQGYGVSRPIPEKDFMAFVKNWSGARMLG